MTMTFEEWIAAHPLSFPISIDYGNTPYQNPLIGDDPLQTYINIRQIIMLIMHIADSDENLEPKAISLHGQTLLGFIRILECLTEALTFEERFRLDPILFDKRTAHSDQSTSDSSKKETVDSTQPPDITSKTYHVFLRKPNGEEIHIGKMQATTIELALAKARKTHSSKIKKGGTIFVKTDPFDSDGT